MKQPDARSAAKTRDVARVVCWLNRWGDLSKHRKTVEPPQRVSQDWVKGYEQAMSDAMRKLEGLAPDWLHTWRDEGWGFHEEARHGAEGF